MSIKSLEEYKFEDIKLNQYLNIDFKGVKKIDELEKLINQKEISIETKEVINIILKFKNENNIIDDNVNKIIFKILITLKNSENRESNFLGRQLINLEKIKKLDRDNNKDHLTGLNNRKSLDEELEKLISTYSREGTLFSILAIDIDYFKKINDTFGHATGDIVLKEIAKLFNQNIRLTDSCYRMGGEEFLIILKGINHDDAINKADDLRKNIEEKLVKSVKILNKSLGFCKNKKNGNCNQNTNCEELDSICLFKNITCSIGVATIKKNENNEAEGGNHLISRADSALYKAKEEGRNRVVSGHVIDKLVKKIVK